jgi:adenosylcobyric acid synthase
MLQEFHLEAEDAINTGQRLDRDRQPLKVVVPVLPRTSNHTDFDALRLNPAVDLQFAGTGSALPAADLIVLPGSKQVRGDLAELRRRGWDRDLLRHLRYGGKLLGICGGFQMLGHSVADPDGIEGRAGSSAGLGLLDISTTLHPAKQLRRTSGRLGADADPGRARVDGYEIHCGVSSGAGLARPFAELTSAADGAVSADRQVMGSYLHGLFDHCDAATALLRWAGLETAVGIDYRTLCETQIERLADTLDQHLDLKELALP